MEIKCMCSGCGECFDCDERIANGPQPVLCDDCESEQAGRWEPDREYQAGYAYACGYHD